MSEALPLRTRLRAEDLSEYEGKAELWHGELIEMSPASGEHGELIVWLVASFIPYLRAHREFAAASEGVGFVLAPDLVLCPDFALYRREGVDRKKFVSAIPFVAVEVLSESNTVSEMIRKSSAFLNAGTEQFWLIDGKNRVLTILRHDVDPVDLTAGILRGEGALEGLEIDLDELFSHA